MATVKNALKFNSGNLLGYLDSKYTLNNAVHNGDGSITIHPGGSASTTLTDSVNGDFRYVKIVNTFSFSGASTENNFRNKPTLIIKEVYKDYTNTIDTVRLRSIAFNTRVTDPKGYKDTTIYSTLDRPMHHMDVTILNDGSTDLVVYSLQYLTSIDISQSQSKTEYQNYMQSNLATTLKFYRNSDSSINGVGIMVAGSDRELKMRVSYVNGQAIAIDTNLGVSIPIQNLIGAIDINT